MYQTQIEHRVAFFETDKAGLVHFSNYYRYFESAEAALFRELAVGPLDAVWGAGPGGVGFVRRRAEMEFMAPSRLDDLLTVRVWIADRNRRSLKLGCVITCGEQLVARGRMETICVTMNGPGQAKSRTIPEELAKALETAPWGEAWPPEQN